MDRNLPIAWFFRLRWIAFVGQGILVAIANLVFKLYLPWIPIAILLGLIPIADVIYRMAQARGISPKKLLGLLLITDTLILTGLLYFTGGPTNPFSIVYLVHVVLAAIMLGERWTWISTIITSGCFLLLFRFHHPVAALGHSHHSEHLSLHLYGMLFSYMLVATLMAYCLTKIVAELKSKNDRLHHLTANQEKLTSLASLAAGTAHELGSPLSTISVVAHELERLVKRSRNGNSLELLDDIQLLKSESARCREIIDRLCSSSGSITGDAPEWVSLEDLIWDLTSGSSERVATVIEGSGDTLVYVPKRPLQMALEMLLKNAIDASTEAETNEAVKLSLAIRAGNLLVEIRDRGKGIDEKVLSRIGEPFFSTKPSGQGMGLGVFLAKLVADQLGGSLRFFSTKGAGTTVYYQVPVNCKEETAETKIV